MYDCRNIMSHPQIKDWASEGGIGKNSGHAVQQHLCRILRIGSSGTKS